MDEALYEINLLQVKYKKKSERKIRYPKINGEECTSLQDSGKMMHKLSQNILKNSGETFPKYLFQSKG